MTTNPTRMEDAAQLGRGTIAASASRMRAEEAGKAAGRKGAEVFRKALRRNHRPEATRLDDARQLIALKRVLAQSWAPTDPFYAEVLWLIAMVERYCPGIVKDQKMLKAKERA